MDTELLCPRCKAVLLYCNGADDGWDYFYCPACQDKAYDPDGAEIGVLT